MPQLFGVNKKLHPHLSHGPITMSWYKAYFDKEQQTATTATGRGVSSFHFSQGFLNGKAFRAVQATALLPGIAFTRTSTKHDQFS